MKTLVMELCTFMSEAEGPEKNDTSILADLVLKRERHGESYARCSVEERIQSYLMPRMPSILCEKNHLRTVRNFTSPGSFNKVFASEWYDLNRVLLVTKCNKVLILDVRTGKYTPIKLPIREPRSFSTRNIGWGNCGKHCIGLNKSRTLFATGGTDPADVVIMDALTMEPKVSLVGHSDWIFGTAWVTESHLVSGSRDCSVALWNIYSEDRKMPSSDSTFPKSHVIRYHNDGDGNGVMFNRDFSARVRDVKFCNESRQLAVLTSDSGIKMLDPYRELAKVKSFYLSGCTDPVCMAFQSNKVAVGCKEHVTMIDPRIRALRHNVSTFHSPDVGSGVRSIEITDHLLSFGTGSGALVFYDVRYVGLSETCFSGNDDSCCGMIRVPIDFGCYDRDAYMLEYHTMNGSQAIYSHKWDHSRTRLFFCGGPLAFGIGGHLCGIYG